MNIGDIRRAQLITTFGIGAVVDLPEHSVMIAGQNFWNPALLAREIATADILTGGRLEVGLGSGHMKWEFDEAGIPWEPYGARADKLSATISELSRLFAGDGYEQQAELRQRLGFPPLLPLQRPDRLAGPRLVYLMSRLQTGACNPDGVPWTPAAV